MINQWKTPRHLSQFHEVSKRYHKIQLIYNIKVLIMYKNMQYIKKKGGNITKNVSLFLYYYIKCCPYVLIARNKNFGYYTFQV